MSPQDQLFSEIALALGLLDTSQLERCRRVIENSPAERDLATVTLELGMLGSGDLEAINKQQTQVLGQRSRQTPPSRAGRSPLPPALSRPPSSRDPAREEEPPTMRRSAVDARAPTLHALQAPITQTPPSGGLVPRTAPAPPSERFIRRMPRRAAVAERAVALQALRDEAAVPMPYLHKALKLAHMAGASDLHLHPNAPLRIRRNGLLGPFQGETSLSAEAIEKVLAQVLTDTEWDRLGQTGNVQTVIGAPRAARGRLDAFRTRSGLGLVIRIIPPEPPTIESLNLPESVLRVLERPRGLIVIAGGRSSGKTTLLAAIARSLLEKQRAVHIVETPVEFRFEGVGSFASHSRRAAAPLRNGATLRPGAVLLVAELSRADYLGLALDAAEEGTPVVACLDAEDAEDALQRLTALAPEAALRQELAEHLTAVVRVRRTPIASGQLQSSAELSVPTAPVRSEIRRGTFTRSLVDAGPERGEP